MLLFFLFFAVLRLTIELFQSSDFTTSEQPEAKIIALTERRKSNVG
ncbi:MAG: hypothetical protein AB8F74_17630 [Saprospiraceae bacterium]